MLCSLMPLSFASFALESSLLGTCAAYLCDHVKCCDAVLQGEIFAAEGYAKVTGDVGVCIATSGPGATNLVTGLADALMDSVPLVAITGQVRVSPEARNNQLCRHIFNSK